MLVEVVGGDPHFRTLDSSTSINTPFNPSSQTIIFNSQIRTTPLSSSNDSATVIRVFSAKSNDSFAERISITVSRLEMLIIRRNETLDLDTINDDTISTNNSLILSFILK